MFVFRFVQHRRVYYIISGIVIAIGIAAMVLSLSRIGTIFPLGIDFVGGSIFELQFTGPGATEDAIRDIFAANDAPNTSVQSVGSLDDHRWSVRTSFQDVATTERIKADLALLAPLDTNSVRVESISASVGAEASRAAVFAVLVATVVVMGYIVLAFRSVPNAIRYGACAIFAMLHDVLIVCGIAAVLGLLFGWEVDALFLTAVLTVVGFSVQDTIVVFDRIRENIPRRLGEPYETIVNRSVIETLHRSLATQLNAFFIMIAIGYTAAALFAVSPAILWHAQDARNYPIWAAAAAISLWLGLVALERRRRIDWALFIAATAVACYLYYLQLFFVAILNLYVIIIYWRSKKLLLHWFISQIILGLILAPWFLNPELLSGGSYAGTAGRIDISEYITAFIPILTYGSSINTELLWLAIGVALALMAIGLYTLTRINRKAALLCVLWGIIPLVLLGIVSTRLNVFVPRYVLAASTVYFVLISGGIYTIWHSKNKILQVAAAGLSFLFPRCCS